MILFYIHDDVFGAVYPTATLLTSQIQCGISYSYSAHFSHSVRYILQLLCSVLTLGAVYPTATLLTSHIRCGISYSYSVQF